LSSGSGSSGRWGSARRRSRAGQIDLLQALTEVEVVALRRQAAIDAQAPMAISTLQLRRNSRSTWMFSALQMPPSIRPMSQGRSA
jgi:hypothetical protein